MLEGSKRSLEYEGHKERLEGIDQALLALLRSWGFILKALEGH